MVADVIHKLVGSRRGRELKALDSYRQLVEKCAVDKELSKGDLDSLEVTLEMLGVTDPQFQQDVGALQQRAALEKEIASADIESLREKRKQALADRSPDAIMKRREAFRLKELEYEQRFERLDAEVARHENAKRELTALVSGNTRLFGSSKTRRSLFG